MNLLLQNNRKTRVSRQVGWLGIDIGSRAVKLAKVERTGGAWKLQLARVVPVPDGADALGVAIEAAQELLGRQARLFGQRVACVMSVHTEMRNIDLPNLSAPELHQHVATQMGPAQATRLFSYWPSSLLQEQKEEQPYHLLMVERQQVTDLAEKLLQCGAECESLDMPPACLARLVKMANPNSSATAAIVDWAYSTPLLTVVRNGQPFYSRYLRDCGFQTLLASVGNSMDLGESEASLLLRRFSATQENNNKLQHTSRAVQRTIASHLRHIAEELEKTIGFLGTEGREAVPEHIYLVGGGACVPGVASEISERVDIPTSVWNLPQRSDELSGNCDATNDAFFASAISLSALPLL